MPRYEYFCDECRLKYTTYRKIAERDEDHPCDECGGSCRRGVASPAITGKMFFGDGNQDGFFSKQLGRRFTSEKEMLEYAESRGLEPVSREDSHWKEIKRVNREEADKAARKAGFRDARHRRAHITENKEDYVRRAQKKKIEKYHAEHGTAGKKTVEEAYGPVAPTQKKK